MMEEQERQHSDAIDILTRAIQGERMKATIGGSGSLAESYCNTLADKLQAAVSLLERYDKRNVSANTASNVQSISFGIPNGLRILADMHGDAIESGNGWACMDISAEFSSGHVEPLCSVDYEAREQVSGDYNRLRVMTFKPGADEPDTIDEPIPHRSIWISHDEGTYDINIWDEDANDRDDFFEIGHIATLEEAERSMKEIMKDHSFIWTVRELQIKDVGDPDDD